MENTNKSPQGLGSFKLWQKLALIAVLMGAGIPYVTYLYWSEKNVAINFGQKEIYGAKYLPHLRQLYEQMAVHRGLAYSSLKGNAGTRDQLGGVEQKVTESFRQLEELERQSVEGSTYGVLLGTTEKTAALKRNWEDVRGKALSGSPKESFDNHTRVINDLRDLISHIGDTSNLILDPDLDSYYLMDAVIVSLPQSLDGLAQARGLLAGVAASGSLTSEDQSQLSFQLARVQNSMGNIKRGMDVAFRANPELGNKMKQAVDTAFNDSENFVKRADGWVRAGKVDATSDQVFAESSRYLTSSYSLYDTSKTNLEDLLNIRISGFNRAKYIALASVAAFVLLALASVLFVSRGIARQLNALTTMVREIEQGNVDARAKVMTADELGQLATSFNTTLDNTRDLMQSRDERDNIQRSIMKLLEEVAGVAEGDLTRQAEVTAEMTGAIADSFNFMILELRQIIGQVKDVSNQVTSSAGETREVTQKLAQNAELQAQEITQTSYALETMASSIQQVSQNAVTSAQVAQQSLQNAQQGTQAVQNTIKGMNRIREQVQETSKRIKRLGESSQEIGEIVQIIDEIADRTSILALNASIQASMAGEAGQGFAVVAEEIERLAERSSEATSKISNLIKTIQMGTNEAISAMEESTREVVEGSKLALQAGQSLTEIENVSEKLADLIQSISLTANTQSRSSEDLAKKMTQISTATQETATSIKMSADTVSGLASLADELRSSVASFKLPDDGRGQRAMSARA